MRDASVRFSNSHFVYILSSFHSHPLIMPPKNQARRPPPLTVDLIKSRDSVPSLKKYDLAIETQNVCNDIDPNSLSHQDLVCWFFWMWHALAKSKQKFLQLKDDHEVSLNQQKAHNASLQLSIKQTSSIQDLKKFENHAMQNSVTASNMRIILLEMAFPSIEVSVDISSPYFPLSYFNACRIYISGDFQCSRRQAHPGEGGYTQVPICRASL
jgi:hypothetical protein